MRREWRNPPRHAGGIHPQRRSGSRLLRCQSCRWVQPPNADNPKGGTRGGPGGCSSTGCLVDLNGACPRELAVARGMAAERVWRARARARLLEILCIVVARHITPQTLVARLCTRCSSSTLARAHTVTLTTTRPVPSPVLPPTI
ncbi:UNVERIFIED_CONTAM: hypothetical protein Sangu_0662900 [Sesamum angustifolium]|uniref:Uncharacterized protein n=1 Tax=Sesamum angustifolium TaxID=2727405 RepID=A0AAW2QCY8_9LAMI